MSTQATGAEVSAAISMGILQLLLIVYLPPIVLLVCTVWLGCRLCSGWSTLAKCPRNLGVFAIGFAVVAGLLLRDWGWIAAAAGVSVVALVVVCKCGAGAPVDKGYSGTAVGWQQGISAPSSRY